MVGESGTGRSGQVHRYYKCVSAKHKKGCDKKSVKKEWIENIVIDQIQRIILDDELIELLLCFRWWDKDIDEINELIPLLTCSELDKVKEEIKRRLV